MRLRGIGFLQKRTFRINGWGMMLDGPDSALAAGQGHLPLQSLSGPLTGLAARNSPQEATRGGTAS
jgi:hypothetical protein